MVLLLMPYASALNIVGTLHFALLRLVPLDEPMVLLVIGAALVSAAGMVRGHFSD
jgi:hypothetical protein